jgi:ankyrin repeat protein
MRYLPNFILIFTTDLILIWYSQETGVSLMYMAAQFGHLAIVQLLHRLSSELIHISPPLTGHSPLWIACNNGHVSVVEFLLSQGAHVNHKDNLGFTCSARAAANGHLAVLRILIEQYGVDPNNRLVVGLLLLSIYESILCDLAIVEMVEWCHVVLDCLGNWSAGNIAVPG